MGWFQLLGNPWKLSSRGRQFCATAQFLGQRSGLRHRFVGIPRTLASTTTQSFRTPTQSLVRFHYSTSTTVSRSSVSLLPSCKNSAFAPASSLVTKATNAIRTSTTNSTVHTQSLRTFNTSHQVGLRQSYSNFSFGSGVPHLHVKPKNFWRDALHRPYIWITIGGVSVLLVGVYIWSLDEVPYTHRKRAILIPEALELGIGNMGFQQIQRDNAELIVRPDHKVVHLVNRVMNRLIEAGPPELRQLSWEVIVLNANVNNAMVLPGGKVCVFSGILPLAHDEEGLACVLAHEVGHVIARHTAEQLSQRSVLLIVSAMGTVLFGVGVPELVQELLFTLPYSRKHETEADYIGLMLMARAGYNPDAAEGFWRRWIEKEKENGGGASPPEFFSTHPASQERVEKIREWLPRAREVYRAALQQRKPPSLPPLKKSTSSSKRIAIE